MHIWPLTPAHDNSKIRSPYSRFFLLTIIGSPILLFEVILSTCPPYRNALRFNPPSHIDKNPPGKYLNIAYDVSVIWALPQVTQTCFLRCLEIFTIAGPMLETAHATSKICAHPTSIQIQNNMALPVRAKHLGR